MKEKIIKEIPLYKGAILNLKRNLVELEDSNLAFREIVEHKKGVALLAVKDDKIIFVKQFRSATKTMMLEIPAGMVDEGESLKEAALRELSEETGFTSNNLKMLGSFYPSPGFTDECVSIFLALDLSEKYLKADDDEKIEIYYFPLKKAIQMIENGMITDMKTALAIKMYQSLQDEN